MFVLGAMPGDRVRARVHKSKRGYAEARAIEVLEPSPERIEPRAPHPGAPWQVLPYERQLAEKEQQVRDALTRIGGFEDPPVEPIVPAESEWRYRNKLEYSFGEDESGDLVLGFHHPGRWDLVDDVTDDILASERIDALRESVKAWAREQGLSAYDRRVERRLPAQPRRPRGTTDGRAPGAARHLRRRLRPRLVRRGGQGRGQHSLDGVGRRRRDHARGEDEEARGPQVRSRRSSPACASASRPRRSSRPTPRWPSASTRLAADAAGLTGREKVFDLYCGSGTIALTLAGYAGEVWGVEVVESAIADAIKNAKLNGVDNAQFFAGDVRTAARPLIEEAGAPDVIVVDPPRAGLSQKIVRRIIEMESPRIVYVSCNPTTLAPNARQLVDDGGYS